MHNGTEFEIGDLSPNFCCVCYIDLICKYPWETFESTHSSPSYGLISRMRICKSLLSPKKVKYFPALKNLQKVDKL